MKILLLTLITLSTSFAFFDDEMSQHNSQSVKLEKEYNPASVFFNNYKYKFKTRTYCSLFYHNDSLTGNLKKDYAIIKRAGFDLKAKNNQIILIPYEEIAGIKSHTFSNKKETFTCLYFFSKDREKSFTVERTMEEYLTQTKKIEAQRKEEYIQYLKLTKSN